MRHLFVYPAQSNSSGIQHDLRWVAIAQDLGWRVCLDAAAFVPTNRLDLGVISAGFFHSFLSGVSHYSLSLSPGWEVHVLPPPRKASQRLSPNLSVVLGSNEPRGWPANERDWSASCSIIDATLTSSSAPFLRWVPAAFESS